MATTTATAETKPKPRGVAPRTIFTGDNLEVLRGIDSDSVDLIYLDPPFNSNADYSAPVGSEAAGAAFKDTWTLSDMDVAEVGLLADTEPALADYIRAVGQVHGGSMMSYLTMMATRLIEMRRVLKPEGSIYLHCDDTAGGYLRGLMDAIFGAAAYRNEITWKRTTGRSDGNQWGRVSDRILFYGGERWNDQHTGHDPEYVKSQYRITAPHSDRYGPACSGDLSAAGTRSGESGQGWTSTLSGRYWDPTTVGRHWAAPSVGRYAEWIAENLIDGYRSIEGVHDRLDALEEAGLIRWPDKDGPPRLLRYLAASPGPKVTDNWTDISALSSGAAERCGYPTQKPVALVERIVAASSNPGDVVLDPFCGCATAAIAAEKLGRDWIGIDLSPKAAELVERRLERELGLMSTTVVHRDDIPRRTDVVKLPPYRTHKRVLYGEQAGDCAGCGCHFEFRHLEVDHVVPRSKGGTDHIENLQLLCGHCNRVKGSGTMAEFAAKTAA